MAKANRSARSKIATPEMPSPQKQMQACELLSDVRSIVEVARALSSARGIEAMERTGMEGNSLSDVLFMAYEKIREADRLLDPRAGADQEGAPAS